MTQDRDDGDVAPRESGTGKRRGTSTSSFGAGAREGHDSTAFYERFRPPVLSTDTYVAPPKPVAEPFVLGDARNMDAIEDNSVALVVTSPPYFVGKQYELELEREGVPRSYLEYLQMLTDVFAECARVLEPGGRIAVNVANLGRKPYRSLSADVIRILEHDLGLLLRGEIIWQKSEGAANSCAWGSFRSAANPVLRDITERVVVASKGRFDRALKVNQRQRAGLPHQSTIMTDDFLAATLDVWELLPESARRVGHPAPFPVELPEQLINLYTYADDLVLDPFMGSGSTLVAAARLGRRFIGYDLDPEYVAIARSRIDHELRADAHGSDVAAMAAAEGSSAAELAREAVTRAGFTLGATDVRLRGAGTVVKLQATDALGGDWWIDVGGPFRASRGGLSTMDSIWRALGRAHAIRGRNPQHTPLVLLTTQLPGRQSDGDRALHAAGPNAFFDIVDVFSPEALHRLEQYATGTVRSPLPGFWAADELTG